MWFWEILPLNFLLFCSPPPQLPSFQEQPLFTDCQLVQRLQWLFDCDCVSKTQNMLEREATREKKCRFNKGINCWLPVQQKSPWNFTCCSGNSKDRFRRVSVSAHKCVCGWCRTVRTHSVLMQALILIFVGQLTNIVHVLSLPSTHYFHLFSHALPLLMRIAPAQHL